MTEFGHILGNAVVRLNPFWAVAAAALICATASAQEAPVRYNHDIRPILSEKCFTCHGPDQNSRKANLRLDSREGAAGVLGPGGAESLSASELYRRITAADPADRMPPASTGKPLTSGEIELLRHWIEQGAPYEKHWAFLPIQRVEPPHTSDTGWVRNDVDRFILARLEEKGMAPNPDADRRTLIRRLSFGLVGLPPDFARVEAFVRDPSPDAYENLVDELMASPHFGERWARHWLDLARFAESHGYEQDYDRKYAYHYRDFVIEAFNHDLPFDTFVKWQIAGDELAPENGLAMMATGFLAAGTHATQITMSQVEKERYDELDDMVRTIGTSMLGLTIGCARCHDHKYDPISMNEYYRMVSTFTKTVRAELPVNAGRGAYEREKARWDKEHVPLAAALFEYERSELPGKFDEWLKAQLASGESPNWLALDINRYSSEGGARLGRLSDESVLAGGVSPEFERYTFEARTDWTGITSVRLDAMADASLPFGGPGRAENGNFALSDFRLTVQSLSPGAKPVDVKLVNARASTEPQGFPASHAIDDDKQTAWAIGSEVGKDHSIVFDLETPIEFEKGSILTFTLEFRCNQRHAIGRPRISISTNTPPVPFDSEPMPQGVLSVLAECRANPGSKLSSKQRSVLFNYFRKQDPKWRDLFNKERQHAKDMPRPDAVMVLVSSEGVPAVRTHTQGGDYLEETHFLKRGDPNQKEGVAKQGFPAVLVRAAEGEARWQMPPPAGARTPYTRSALANWITDARYGAGELLARVIVNRLWQHHMGRGIVPTPSDFGFKGEPPSHPELLDWLASELIRSGWSLKRIHKLILMSSTYRQSADTDPGRMLADSENSLFWHHGRQRLEAEAIRDAMLAASGELDPSMFGPSTLDPDHKRRSIYFMVKRSRLVPMMTLFDAPDSTQGIADRSCTTVAPQALMILNNEAIRKYAGALARRVRPNGEVSYEDAVKTAYGLALSRAPRDTELAESLAFLDEQAASYAAAGHAHPESAALTDFAQALLALNEFVYID